MFNHSTDFRVTCILCESNAHAASTLGSRAEVSRLVRPTHNAAHHYFLLLCEPWHLASTCAVWANCLPLFLYLNDGKKIRKKWIVHKNKSTREVNACMRWSDLIVREALNPGRSRWFPRLSFNLMDNLHKLSLGFSTVMESLLGAAHQQMAQNNTGLNPDAAFLDTTQA